MRVLISGASIAGPVLAYWLARYRFDVTVVERTPALRKSGGHAVDLFRPAMEISEKMGVLERIEARTTGATRMTIHRGTSGKPIRVDLTKLFGATSDRHVEIMRDDLAEIYCDAGRDDVEYLFGDSITSISPDGEVTFQQGASRRFDVVVGADGLHSNVRRLVFGEEAGLSSYIGAYLAVLSAPKTLAREGENVVWAGPGLLSTIYTADHLPDARAVFIFRRDTPFDYDYRDTDAQKQFLRNAFGSRAAMVDDWLAELDRTPSFYFDSVTQLQLNRWSRGRVSLVGDAGYCPGPAVGGSTSLAVVGAYILAGELARAGADHEAAFAAYERVMADPVQRSRAFARRMAKRLVPRSRAGVWALARGAQLFSRLPAGLSRAIANANSGGLRVHDAMPVPEYSMNA